MSALNYTLGRAMWRACSATCLRVNLLHRQRLNHPGGFVLACSHLSHLEPAILSILHHRQIDWMARLEFYKHPLAARLLHAVDAFPVNRFGRPVRAIRTAIARVNAGKIVGIFPEGGVARGSESVLLGGAIKGGAALIAQRTHRPIIPVAVLGTEQLLGVTPWLPLGRTRLQISVGWPIVAGDFPGPRRQARQAITEHLQRTFMALHDELQQASRR